MIDNDQLSKLTICLLFSKKDLASMNIYKYIHKYIQTICGNVSKKSYTNIEVIEYVSNIDHIENNNVDAEVEKKFSYKSDVIIFVSRHKSSANVKCLTVHPIGNINEANLGGLSKTIVAVPSFVMTSLFYNLKKVAKEFDYQGSVNFEQTHHGPYLNTPSIFIEIGSNEQEWKDDKNAKIIARCLVESLSEIDLMVGRYKTEYKESNTYNNEKNIKINIVFGSGHYSNAAERCLYKHHGYIGHIVSKYNLKYLDEKMLKQLLNKSYVISNVFDKMLMGGSVKIEKILAYDKKGVGSHDIKTKFLQLLHNFSEKYNIKVVKL